MAVPKPDPHPRMVVGRIAWDKSNEYHTPWVSFRNVTEFRKWARDMRAALGGSRKIRAEYHLVNTIWTPERLLANAREKS